MGLCAIMVYMVTSMPKKRSRLRKTFHKYFISGKHNGYRPYFLRAQAVSVTALVIVGLFIGSIGAGKLLRSNSPQIAAVVASSLVDLANEDRGSAGLGMLTVDARLQQAAQLKANDMVAKGYFAHVAPDGHDPWYWFGKAGYDFSAAGENLAVFYTDSAAVNDAWMHSPEHRANILNGTFTQIGIALADGMYEGQPATFVVQEFGTPAIAVATPVSVTGSVVTATGDSQRSPAIQSQPRTPAVAGASAQAVRVVDETPTFIAVERADASTTPMQPVATSAPVQSPQHSLVVTTLLRIVTSPHSDLAVVYEMIAALIALVLILEVVLELRSPHPHHLLHALFLFVLMLALLFAVPLLMAGNLVVI